MNKKIINSCCLVLIMVLTLSGVINVMAQEVEKPSFSITDNITNNDNNTTTIDFILNDDTSFKDEKSNKDFNITEIIDTSNNNSIDSLTYNTDKRDEYHFLVKYITSLNKDENKIYQLDIDNHNDIKTNEDVKRNDDNSTLALNPTQENPHSSTVSLQPTPGISLNKVFIPSLYSNTTPKKNQNSYIDGNVVTITKIGEGQYQGGSFTSKERYDLSKGSFEINFDAEINQSEINQFDGFAIAFHDNFGYRYKGGYSSQIGVYSDTMSNLSSGTVFELDPYCNSQQTGGSSDYIRANVADNKCSINGGKQHAGINYIYNNSLNPGSQKPTELYYGQYEGEFALREAVNINLQWKLNDSQSGTMIFIIKRPNAANPNDRVKTHSQYFQLVDNGQPKGDTQLYKKSYITIGGAGGKIDTNGMDMVMRLNKFQYNGIQPQGELVFRDKLTKELLPTNSIVKPNQEIEVEYKVWNAIRNSENALLDAYVDTTLESIGDISNQIQNFTIDDKSSSLSRPDINGFHIEIPLKPNNIGGKPAADGITTVKFDLTVPPVKTQIADHQLFRILKTQLLLGQNGMNQIAVTGGLRVPYISNVSIDNKNYIKLSDGQVNRTDILSSEDKELTILKALHGLAKYDSEMIDTTTGQNNVSNTKNFIQVEVLGPDGSPNSELLNDLLAGEVKAYNVKITLLRGTQPYLYSNATLDVKPTYFINYSNEILGLEQLKNMPSNGVYNPDTGAVSASIPTAKGYTFKNWLDKTSQQTFSPSQSLHSVNQDLNLVAQWEPNKYYIMYHANNNTDATTRQEFTYNVAQSLNKNPFTYSGYDFKGWSTTPGGDVVYTDEQSNIKNLTAENNGIVNLYAVWSKLNVDAKNFTISANEAKSLTSNNALTKADAKILDSQNVDVTEKFRSLLKVNTQQLQTIKQAGQNDKPGLYDLEVMISENGQTTSTKLIKVSIFNDQTQVNPEADGDKTQAEVFINVQPIYTINLANIDQLATNIKKLDTTIAWTNTNKILNDNLVVTPQSDIRKAGAYIVNVSASDNGKTATASMKVNVYDDDTATDNDANKDEANVFLVSDETKTIELAQVNNFKEDAVNQLHASAWNKDQTPVSVSADTNQVLNKIGRYPVTLSATDNHKTATKTVYVSVVDQNVEQSNGYFITAHNVTYKLPANKTKSLTEVISDARIEAWSTTQSVEELKSNIQIDKLNEIQQAETAKSIIVQATIQGQPTPVKKFFVNIVDNNTVTVGQEEPTNESTKFIRANDFSLSVEEAKALNEDSAKTNAAANAWKLSEDVVQTLDVTVENAELQKIKQGVVGSYQLTFKVENENLVKPVVVNITDNNTVCQGGVCITASDFNYNLTEVRNLNDDIVKAESKVKAWYENGDTQPPLTIVVDPAQLETIKNTKEAKQLDLSFSANSAKVSIKVNVVDNNYTLSAQSGSINYSELPISAQNLISKLKATATRNDTHAPGTVEISEKELKKLNDTKEGVVSVTLYVKEQPTIEKIVNVNIVPQDATLGDKTTIQAQNFSIKLSKVNTLTGEQAIISAHAVAWNNDGSQPNPTIVVDTEQLQEINRATVGVVLPLTFSVEGDSKASKQIQVTIINNKELIMPGIDGQIGTNDDVVVKPNPDDNGDYPEKAEDGSVTLPNGGVITIPGMDPNEDINVPNGSIIKPDGTIVTPNDQELLPQPNGGIELPGKDSQLTDKPDNPLVKPTPGSDGKGQIDVNTNGSVTLPNGGNITFPNNSSNQGSISVPNGSTVEPDGTITTASGNVVSPDKNGNIELPGIDNKFDPNQDNLIINPDGANNAVVNEDGSVFLPESGIVTFPNANSNDTIVKFPAESTIKPNGTIVLPGADGTPGNDDDVNDSINPDGTITLPGQDNNLNNVQDNITVRPNGNPVINKDGSVFLPDGGTVILPDGTQIDVPAGTIVKPDGTIILPGTDGKPGNGDEVSIKPNPDGTITIPGVDGELGTEDDQTVKPKPGSKPSIDQEGNITLPEGGTVIRPDGTQVDAPAGSIVKPDGTIIYPNGGIIHPDGSITVPGADGKPGTDDDITIKPNPDKPTEKPELKPDGSVVIPPGGSIVTPGGEITFPDGGVVNPDGTITVPGADGIPGTDDDVTLKPNPDGSITIPGPDGVLGTDDDQIVKPNPGSKPSIDQEGNITLPGGGTVVNPDGSQVDVPAGSIVKPDGTVIVPGADGKPGTDDDVTLKPNPDGTITIPGVDGELGTDDDQTVKPKPGSKPSIDQEGNITLPEGGTVIRPDGTQVDAPAGSIVKPDGTIIYPNGGIIHPDGSITVPGADGKPGTDDDITIKPNPDKPSEKPELKPDGSVVIPPGGSIVTPGGEITFPDGGVVNPDGTITVPGADGIPGTDDDVTLKPNPDGSITIPGVDGELGTDDDQIVKPKPGSKPSIDQEGNITLPEGGTVIRPDGTEVDVPPGTIVKPDGTIIYPDGSVTTPDGKGIINAQNKQVFSSEAIATINSPESLIKEMQATATYNNEPVTPSVTCKDIDKIKAGKVGSYPVTFTLTGTNRSLGNTASVTRMYTIVADIPVVSETQPNPNKSEIGANTGTNIAITTLVVLILSATALIVIRRKKN